MKKISKWKVISKKTTRIILIILCGAVLGINVYLTNANRLMGDSLPMPFGYGAAVVLSGSMEPEMFKGDLIVVKELETYRQKDIVVYQSKSSLVVHRIISIDGDAVITQGDANNTPDDPISLSAIKGKVLFRVPYVGSVVNLIKTPIGTVGIIAIAILLIEIPRKNEKKKDDEEKQKILEEIARLKKERES